MNLRTARRPRGDRGSTLVEFALVVPVLLVVMLGILQYGYHFWALQTASATAREAARRLAVGTAWTCTSAEAVDRLAGPAVSAVPTPTYRYGSGASTASVGDLVTVTVSFQSLYVGLLPVPGRGWVSESATSRVENVPDSPLNCSG
jgi:Flp pilus assembly protein TadG